MVEIAELSIKGSLETTDIEQGMDRIDQGFKVMSSMANVTFGAFNLLASVAKTLGKILITAGVAGTIAMTALASKAPAVAPALAKMSIQFRQMSFTLGQHLAPAFNAIADELLPALGDAIENNGPQLDAFVSKAVTGIGYISTAVTVLSDLIKKLFPDPKPVEELSFTPIQETNVLAQLGGEIGGPIGAGVLGSMGLFQQAFNRVIKMVIGEEEFNALFYYSDTDGVCKVR